MLQQGDLTIVQESPKTHIGPEPQTKRWRRCSSQAGAQKSLSPAVYASSMTAKTPAPDPTATLARTFAHATSLRVHKNSILLRTCPQQPRRACVRCWFIF